MSAVSSSGSPAAREKASASFTIHDETSSSQEKGNGLRQVNSVSVCRTPNRLELMLTYIQGSKHAFVSSDSPSPLITSKLGNVQSQPGSRNASGYKVSDMLVLVCFIVSLTIIEVKA